MDIKSFQDLIDWSRELHHHLARCMRESMDKQNDDKAKALLEYLAEHEDRLEKVVEAYERQTSENTLNTRVYDYLANGPVTSHRTCSVAYSQLDYEGICKEVFDYHDQVINLYKSLLGKAETADAYDVMKSLLEMEEHEAMLLAQQVDQGRSL